MENKNDWKMESISIEFQRWGDFAGKYIGKIKFANEASESFSFNLTPDMVKEYLKPITDTITRSASELSDTLMRSLENINEEAVVEDDESEVA